MVGQQLRHGPVSVAVAGLGDLGSVLACSTHLGGLNSDGELHIQRAALPVGVAAQIRQRLWIFGRAGESCAIGRQRFQRHHPGRDAGSEVLREEGTERLVFPGLHIAGGPVVQQAQAEDVVFGIINANRLAPLVACTGVDAHLQLIVQTVAGLEYGIGIGSLELTLGALEIHARDTNARRTAVVANRHPLVVFHQRVGGAKQLAHIGRVIDGGVEVRVVAHLYGHGVFHFGLRHQAGLECSFCRRA